ncbi:HAD family hydrolase [Paractinoplanes toevensis]|uniref:Haloacid dehalogenase n=1 Tax=Paractinoplanes toevensis TaxID=571911 RepID=A0A919T9M0_9ACTN|nr:HAD family hydrolase [Actinoplanes toevensis]GIM90661.1 haloacid dehalogenase [Actinoplanes toevensis]
MSRSGILFDVDGTLVDSTYLHAVAWWQALRRYGHDVPMAEVHRAVGMGSDMLLDHLLGDAAEEGIADAHDEFYQPWWEQLRPLPAAADLLRACAERGLAVVLASSAKKDELETLRRVIDADDVIAAATSSDDAKQSKPAPDILQAALDQSGVDAQQCVFVGDSVWDVEAAARLGIPCIGLTCGGTSAAELESRGAVATYEDPAALLESLEASPIARLH